MVTGLQRLTGMVCVAVGVPMVAGQHVNTGCGSLTV